MEIIKKAITEAGGIAEMAAKIGVGPTAVSNWQLRKKVPAERCLAIEAATDGAVTRYELRPDVFGAPPAKREAG